MLPLIPLPQIGLPLYMLITALTPLLCEMAFKLPAHSPRHLHPVTFLLTPMIGTFAGLGLLGLVTSPWVALTLHIAIFVVMVVISNAKLRVLRMVAAAQDTENFRHVVLYPDFYLVHLGLWRVLAGGVALATLVGWLISLDKPLGQLPLTEYAVLNWLGGLALWFAGYKVLMRLGRLVVHEKSADTLGIPRDPNEAAARWGYYGALLLHSLLVLDQRHLAPLARTAKQSLIPPKERPNIILFQGESYMDLTRIDSLAGGTVPWPTLEKLRASGAVTGPLDVPAWGAYTMQTEMAVLTGIDRHAYKTASINPYQVLASQLPTWSLAMLLREQGYRTLCLHPAKRGFFRRHKAMPNLGFDEFLSLSDFKGAERYGPYVSDAALVKRVEAILAESDQPTFLHLISIESHGPWETGRLAPWEDERALLASEPTGDMSFALYRQHMENLIQATDRLLDVPAGQRPRALGLYGDHLGAHGPLFDRLGFTDDRVDYVLARSDSTPALDSGERRAEDFGQDLLHLAGFTAEREKNTDSH